MIHFFIWFSDFFIHLTQLYIFIYIKTLRICLNYLKMEISVVDNFCYSFNISNLEQS